MVWLHHGFQQPIRNRINRLRVKLRISFSDYKFSFLYCVYWLKYIDSLCQSFCETTLSLFDYDEFFFLSCNWEKEISTQEYKHHSTAKFPQGYFTIIFDSIYWFDLIWLDLISIAFNLNVAPFNWDHAIEVTLWIRLKAIVSFHAKSLLTEKPIIRLVCHTLKTFYSDFHDTKHKLLFTYFFDKKKQNRREKHKFIAFPSKFKLFLSVDVVINLYTNKFKSLLKSMKQNFWLHWHNF